jgi:hypothetical protein
MLQISRSSSPVLSRPNGREVIETLVLEPPFSAYAIKDFSEFSLSSRKNHHNNKSMLSAAPHSSLEKPKQIRMVSFQGQQELTEKLNGVMLLHSFGQSMISSGKNHTEDHRPTKHCIVDLDEAFERYPPIPPSLFTASWDSSDCEYDDEDTPDFEVTNFSSPASDHAISVIPEPPEEDWGGAWIQHSGPAFFSKKDQIAKGGNTSNRVGTSTQRRSIQRDDVLRTRHWGQRLRIPSHLLRPPMIQRQRSSE